MFDHVGFGVGDYATSKAFFLAPPGPLGIGPDGHNVEAVCHRPRA